MYFQDNQGLVGLVVRHDPHPPLQVRLRYFLILLLRYEITDVLHWVHAGDDVHWLLHLIFKFFALQLFEVVGVEDFVHAAAEAPPVASQLFNKDFTNVFFCGFAQY